MIKIYNLKGKLLYDVKSPEFNKHWDSNNKEFYFTVSWVNDYHVGVAVDLHYNSKFYFMIAGKKFGYSELLEKSECIEALIEQETNKEAIENLPG